MSTIHPSDYSLVYTQGSCVLVFISPERAGRAFARAIIAFETDGQFDRKIKIRIKNRHNSRQPDQPWCVDLGSMQCIVCGLAQLPSSFKSIMFARPPTTTNEQILITAWPPILIANEILLYGIRAVEIQSLNIEIKTIPIAARAA